MNKEQDYAKVVSVLLMALAATFGVYSIRDRSSTMAPGNAGVSAGIAPGSDQTVIARLWEDPLQAVESYITTRGKGAETNRSITNLTRSIRNLGSSTTNLSILLVSIPETSFPDDKEVRLRLRYTVQTALASKSFSSRNRDAVGFVHLDVGEGLERLIAPFEWYEGPKRTEALVLWLPEAFITKNSLSPILSMAWLAKELGIDQVKVDGKPRKLLMIGPRSSDTLRALLQSEYPSHASLSNLLGRFAIFSPEATAPDDVMMATQDVRTNWAGARGSVNEKFEIDMGTYPGWRYFENFIAPDDQLTDLIVSELLHRNIDIAGKRKTPDRILILTEADTSYGRSLPRAFEASIESVVKGQTHFAPTNSSSLTARLIKNQSGSNTNLSIFRYLRGLDQQKGQPRSESQTEKVRARSAEETISDAVTRKGAMALGESQMDYVERLAMDVASKGERDVKAVGILGGDLYDKLILLKTLRPKFPNALFFTTDLDARLWHPNHISFTRNLVVASAYDINDSQSDGFKSPPFRDVYQTAIFKAVRFALERANGGALNPFRPDEPSLFELGRLGPVSLVSSNSVGTTTPPSIFSSNQKKGLLCIIGSCVVAAAIFLAFCHSVGGFQERSKCLLKLLAASIAPFLIFVPILWMIDHISRKPGEEPFSFFDGVSAWPTELIRLSTTLFVIWVLIWARLLHIKIRDKIYRKFLGSSAASPKAPGSSSILGALTQPWPGRQSTISAANTLALYMAKGRFRCRMIRAAVGMLLYTVFAMGIVLLVDGGVPANAHIRGELSRSWDMKILFTAVIAVLFLVFYVLDAVVLTALLFRSICGRHTVWPRSVRNEYRKRFNIRGKALASFIDVDFAAAKSEGTSRLLFYPFVVLFLLLVSRASYIDAWSWPTALIGVFVFNIILGCASWVILRREARLIREDATRIYSETLDRIFKKMADENAKSTPSKRLTGFLDGQRETIERMQKATAAEHRGAYEHFIQDPAVLAMLVPSSALGIVAILFQILFGGF